jgi:probable HAF family extracellular repeat protein
MVERALLLLVVGALVSATSVAEPLNGPQYTITDLGTLGGSLIYPEAINAADQVTGWASLPDGSGRAFRSDGTTMTDLGTLGGSWSRGVAINAAGQVTGTASLPDGSGRAFRSDGTTMTDLGTLGGLWSSGQAINAAGQVTGVSQLSDGWYHAFRSDGTTMTDLGTLGGFWSGGRAINEAGQVTGASHLSDGTYHAFRSDGTTMTDLGTLGGSWSEGVAINAAGQVTGWARSSDGSSRAFVANPGAEMLDLNTLIPAGTGWTLLSGAAINDAGQITGVGIFNGMSRAFLLTPVRGFTFTGFLRPIDNSPTLNVRNAGAAVPVKFGLGGDHGLGIFASGYPRSQQVACQSGALMGDAEQTVTPGRSALRYDPSSDQYIYVWATDKAWAGECRQLQLKFTDGQTQTATFWLRR